MGKAIYQGKPGIQILAMVNSGTKVDELAAEYSVSKSTIYKWIRPSVDGSGCSCNQARQVRRPKKKVETLYKIIGRYWADGDNLL